MQPAKAGYYFQKNHSNQINQCSDIVSSNQCEMKYHLANVRMICSDRKVYKAGGSHPHIGLHLEII